MIRIKSPAAYRPFMFVLSALIFWTLCLGDTAEAQRRRTTAAVGTIPVGTTINVRTIEDIETNDADGEVFHGVVDQDVFGASGSLVIPKGSDAELIVKEISDDELALDLDSIVIRGQRYAVETAANAISSERKEGIGANERTGKYIGGGAILGAIIGGIAGGGKGAAIGAGAGAAAGAGAQVLTRGGKIEVPSESLLTFRLAEPMRAGVADSGYMQNGNHYHRNNTATSSAYQQGWRDGQSDFDRNLPRDPYNRRLANVQERRDYAAGYNDAFDNRENGSSRQKPGYSNTARWSISAGPYNEITWQAPENANVYVQIDNGAPRLFGSGESGTQAANWMRSGHLYTFILKDGYGREISRTNVDRR